MQLLQLHHICLCVFNLKAKISLRKSSCTAYWLKWHLKFSNGLQQTCGFIPLAQCVCVLCWLRPSEFPPTCSQDPLWSWHVSWKTSSVVCTSCRCSETGRAGWESWETEARTRRRKRWESCWGAETQEEASPSWSPIQGSPFWHTA